jgi:hypothetical protein
MYVYNHSKLHLCDLGERANLNVGDKERHACEEQYPGPSHQNISDYFS